MAHYYFDLKNGTTERDHTGLDLDSDIVAIARARTMADQVSMRSATAEGPERHICVIHEDGHEVMRVRVEKPGGGASAPRLEKFS